MGNKESSQSLPSFSFDSEKEGLQVFSRIVKLSEDGKNADKLYQAFIDSEVEIDGKKYYAGMLSLRKSFRSCRETAIEERLEKKAAGIYSISIHRELFKITVRLVYLLSMVLLFEVKMKYAGT